MARMEVARVEAARTRVEVVRVEAARARMNVARAEVARARVGAGTAHPLCRSPLRRSRASSWSCVTSGYFLHRVPSSRLTCRTTSTRQLVINSSTRHQLVIN